MGVVRTLTATLNHRLRLRPVVSAHSPIVDYTIEQRRALAKQGNALPDGSFPIANRADLENAIHAIGRASDPAAAKGLIRRRARALNAVSLIPLDWN